MKALTVYYCSCNYFDSTKQAARNVSKSIYRCEMCMKMVDANKRFANDKAVWAKAKYKIISSVLKIVDGTSDIASKESQDAIISMTRINKIYLNADGLMLKAKAKLLQRYIEGRIPQTKDDANNFVGRVFAVVSC